MYGTVYLRDLYDEQGRRIQIINKRRISMNIKTIWKMITDHASDKEKGLDGILVTIGLCIIALLLCVVMKDSLTEFIQTIVKTMTDSAKGILGTPAGFTYPEMRFL